jgi:hypothetical protein
MLDDELVKAVRARAARLLRDRRPNRRQLELSSGCAFHSIRSCVACIRRLATAAGDPSTGQPA